MRGLYVKEGPTVFLTRVFLMEIVAGVALFVLSYASNYEMLYRGAKLDVFLRYDIFLMVAFSLFQLVYLLTIFLNWYFSYFELRDTEVVKKSGIIFHKKQAFPLSGVVSIGTRHSPIDRLIGHATIILEGQYGPIVKMRNVPNYRDYVDHLKRLIHSQNSNGQKIATTEIIERGETAKVEFKETLRFDVKTEAVSKDLERAVLKSVVGFMNTDGGMLFIGVRDDSRVFGLERDYKTLLKQNRDGFENHLYSLLRSMIGVNFAKLVEIGFEKYEGKEICVVDIKPSTRPAYLKQGEKEEFFVRTGNSTRSLSMSETEEYIRTRFEL